MTRDKQRIPELDGIRALLIFIVSWFHIWQQSWMTPRIGSTSLDFVVRSGYMHVDATVLMSAFLLFLPWARARLDNAPMPDVRSFYRRRFMRVYPSYLFICACVFFAVALPYGLYATPQYLVKDVFTHLTFTFNFFADTYQATPLGAACWTLAVEVQAYVLFPWVARAAARKPVRTLTVLALLGWGFRAWCAWALDDYSLVVNQLAAFLDVYAAGIALSMLYVRLCRVWEQDPRKAHRALWQLAATSVACAALYLLITLMHVQADSVGYPGIQLNQMKLRFPLALVMGTLFVSLPFAVRPLRFLFGNRVMSFLGGISMNYYLIHQTVAVHLRRIGFPPSVSDIPNRVAEQPWQRQYTALCFSLSFVLAVLVTYLIERPCAAWLKKRFAARDAAEAARCAQKPRLTQKGSGENDRQRRREGFR